MEIPNQVRLRLLLTSDKIVFRKFYWFEMNKEDFYWGSAYKSARSENAISKIDGTQVDITIPDDFSELPKLNGKYSYHESGDTHYKTILENDISIYSDNSKWILKGEIKKPVRFYTVFSKTFKNYDKNIENLTKGNSSALVLAFDTDVFDKRIYFEFFLSPEGTFEIPEPLIKFDKPLNQIATHSLSKNLILIIRYAVMGSLDQWHPDKEIAIIPNELN